MTIYRSCRHFVRASARLCLLAALATPGLAQAQSADGNDHANRAVKAYNIQDWPTALKEYRAAYAADAKPDYLWSIAQTQRLSGDCRGAILTYKAYQRTASTTAANAAQDWIKTCESDLAAQQRAVDQAAAATPPPPAPAAAPPAKPAPPSPPPPSLPNHIWYADPLGDTLALVGIGGVVVGSVFLAQAKSQSSSATSGNEGSWRSDSNNAKTDSIIGGIGLGAGGAFLLGAVWRYAVVGARAGDEKSPPPPVGLSLGHSNVQASYVATF